MTTTVERSQSSLREAVEALEIALPAVSDALGQDEEWVVVNVDGEWTKVRLHDYPEVFAIQGLYEKWVYEVLRCGSPDKIRDLLAREIRKHGSDPKDFSVLDLGAGNGCVAEALADLGIDRFVGIDLHKEAAEAAERDRPDLYDDYVVGDLLNLPEAGRRRLASHEYNCMTCVAALGFGDIPPAVFAKAYNQVSDGGWIAFTIKSDFLDPNDDSGFSTLVRKMIANKVLEPLSREAYMHRIAIDGSELEYTAFIGRKRSDIPEELVVQS